MRALALILLLANLLYWGWSQGALLALGWGPQPQTEPHRLQQQIEPQRMRLLDAQALAQVQEQLRQDHIPRECLQATGLTDAQAQALQPLLQAGWPEGSWELRAHVQSERWLIYMGKYPNAQALARKRAELGNMHIKAETVTVPALEPGLSLGAFESRDKANDALTRLHARGVQSARVVQEREAQRSHSLRLPAVSLVLQARLPEVRAILDTVPLRNCD